MNTILMIYNVRCLREDEHKQYVIIFVPLLKFCGSNLWTETCKPSVVHFIWQAVFYLADGILNVSIQRDSS